jgi:DNA-binding PucR family transcriptional regulator
MVPPVAGLAPAPRANENAPVPTLAGPLAALRDTTPAFASALAEYACVALAASSAGIFVGACPGELEGPFPNRYRRRMYVEDPALATATIRRAFARPDDDVVPLVDREILVGVALVSSRRASAQMLETFGGDAARAIAAHLALQASTEHNTYLEAMLDTTRALAGEHHPDALMRQIVAHARRAVGSDVASVALVDQGGARMQASTGTIGPFFDSALVARGMSLVGTIVETGEPLTTINYLSDDRFPHDAAIDANVEAEGLRSILGVPMRAGGDVVGVLCVSTRKRRRRFRPSEVRIVAGLANQAALAYINTRRYEDARAASERLDGLRRNAERRTQQLRRSAALQDRLTELVLADRDLGELVAAVAELTSRPAAVASANGELLAAVGDAPQLPWHTSRLDAHAVVQDVDGNQLLTPVAAAGEVLGTLRLGGSPDEHVQSVARDAARAVALVLLRQRAVEEAADRLRGEFVDELLDPRAREEDVVRRGKRLGIDVRSDHLIAIASAGSGVQPLVRRQTGVVAMVHRGRHVVFLAGGGDVAWRHAGQIATRAVADGIVPVVAVSAPAAGVAGLRAAYAEALRCLAAADPERDGPLATPRALGARFLLADGGVSSYARRFSDDLLEPLERAPTRGGDLVRTIEAVFEHGGNLLAAARALHLHPNTLYARLAKIESLTGRDIRKPDDAFELQLALRLRLRSS